MVVDIDLNPVVIYRRNIDHRNSFILLVVCTWKSYNISRRNVCTYTLNCMCPILGTLTHIILQDVKYSHIMINNCWQHAH